MSVMANSHLRSERLSPSDSRQVEVTLLLRWGHRHSLKLDAEDPILVSLLEAVAKGTGDPGSLPTFNVATHNRVESLVFSGSDLVGIITKPPISIDVQTVGTEINFSQVIKNGYLSKKQNAALLLYTVKHAKKFRPSKISSHDRPRRDSKSLSVLDDVGEFEEILCDQVRAELPEILTKLKIPEFPVAEIGCQLLRYNNGHYLGRHRDHGPPPGDSRVVTFGYYFHKEPRRFEGGSLRLYKGVLENGIYTCGEPAIDLDLPNNTMLFFPSACFHEVLPVKCLSRRFEDSRFTINGWIHKAA